MMIRVIGLDKCKSNPKNISVTLLTKKQTGGEGGGGQSGSGGGKGGGGSQKQDSLILNNEVPTFLQSEREFQTYSDKRIFWGHVDYYLIGEDAAKEGIQRYIDFLTRDHDMRGTSKIYIIKGSTAKDFIQKGSSGDYFMPDRLKAIGENSILIAGAQQLELIEFVNMLNKKYSCAIAPVLHLKQKVGDKKEGEQPQMDVELEGYSVFKNFKLVNFLNREQSNGVNFLTNRIVSGFINVKDLTGGLIGLDLVSSKTKIKPVFNGNELQKVEVKIEISSNINEVQSKQLNFNEKTIVDLEAKQADEVKNNINNAISIAQKNNTDFLDMAGRIGSSKPTKWNKNKFSWYKIFPKLPISVNVESKINRTYDLREPSGLLEDEHK